MNLDIFCMDKNDSVYFQPIKFKDVTIATNSFMLVVTKEKVENARGANTKESVQNLLNIIDSYRKATRTRRVEYKSIIFESEKCKCCHGSGKVKIKVCPECDGEGEVHLTSATGYHTYYFDLECLTCNGGGDIYDENGESSICGVCYGTGQTLKIDDIKRETVTVGEKKMSYKWYGYLKTLNNVVFFECEGFKAIYFTFDGGDGLVMPNEDRTSE